MQGGLMTASALRPRGSLLRKSERDPKSIEKTYGAIP